MTARFDAGSIHLAAASGGLATGLRDWYERNAAVWIGWPGALDGCTAAERADLDRSLEQQRIVPVHLSSEEAGPYYEGFANGVLWPLFHYLVDRVPVEPSGWEAYRHANEMFARAAAAEYRPGDVIWVHDYQLMLVPGLLRERLPDARIGFFLHIPFPSSEVFRILPWRREILFGLLSADLVGFHTFAYLRHFVTSLLHLEGIEAQVDRVHLRDREVRLGVFPMGVDVREFESIARDPDVQAEAAALREDAGDRSILLGVDRLDYTKGIPRKLLAIERLLNTEPALRDRVRFIQVAVPSRGKVDAYQAFRRQVEERVGRINGACATLRSVPIHYLHRSVSRRQLVALYCAADVMLVTPLRDGMNLVAKEFLASRVDTDGVLVLSEFAGAAAELGEALVVNPYDVDAVARAIKRALTMPLTERRARMLNLRRRVAQFDVEHWASRFVEQLRSLEPPHGGAQASVRQAPLTEAAAALRRSRELTLLLDYDGSLVPIASSPDLAVPDDELMSLLAALATRPGTAVHIVSGRPREILEEWFGHLSVSLSAEHGFWHRRDLHSAWVPAMDVPANWADKVSPILEQFTASTPGSLIERKSASMAWHYRIAHAEFGARQAHELRMLLGDALSNQPLEVFEGKKVIEVRLRGVSKALAAQRLQPTPGTHVLAIGDDQTDEDLFAALPDTSMTIAVGNRPSRATYRVADCHVVRRLLRSLLS